MNSESTFCAIVTTLVLSAFLSGAQIHATEDELALKNPGFEQADEGWSQPVLQTRGVEYLPEAAKSGRLGVRITDLDPQSDVTLTADPVLATPGKAYRVSFDGRVRNGERGLNVFVRFLDKNQKPIVLPDGHRYHFMLSEQHTEWARHSFEAVAPNDAAFAQVYLRTNKRAVVVADVDNISIEPLP